MKRLFAILKVQWMKMEIERCKYAASQVPVMERELFHYRVKNAHLLPESMRITWSNLK